MTLLERDSLFELGERSATGVMVEASWSVTTCEGHRGAGCPNGLPSVIST